MKKRDKILVGIELIALVFVIFGGVHYTFANPSFFVRGTPTATATSSLVYMTPGKATTTVSLPSTTSQNTDGYESAVLKIQVTASSTGVAGAVKINAHMETSIDGIDWYLFSAINGTSTPSTNGIENDLQITISTSTPIAGNFGGTGSSTTIFQDVALPNIPSEYFRLRLYDPVGGGNYGIWAIIEAKKQSPSY